MPTERKNYTPKDKVAILRRHLLDHIPVSQLCDEDHLQPTLFYRWQKQFFENGAAAFAAATLQVAQVAHERNKIARLEEKLARKNEVVAELLEEHAQLKKAALGRSEPAVGRTGCARRSHRLHLLLAATGRVASPSGGQVGRHCREQIFCLAKALWASQ